METQPLLGIDHQVGVLVGLCHRFTNATAESLNALIQQIKANAKGFRKWESFRIAIRPLS